MNQPKPHVAKQRWYAQDFGRKFEGSCFNTWATFNAQDYPRTRMTLASMSFNDDARDYAAMREREQDKVRGIYRQSVVAQVMDEIYMRDFTDDERRVACGF